MSNNYNEAITRRMIVRLHNTYADCVEAHGPKAIAVAKARWAGLVEGSHFALQAMGISPGSAPFAVEADVIAVIREVGDRPPFTTANTERKAWGIAVTERLLNLWTSGDEPTVTVTGSGTL